MTGIMGPAEHKLHIRQVWLVVLLSTLLFTVLPDSAFAVVIPAPPTCTDPTNNYPDYNGFTNTWSCIPISSNNAQWDIHFLQTAQDYNNWCANNGWPGTQTLVVPDPAYNWQSGNGQGCAQLDANGNHSCTSAEIQCVPPGATPNYIAQQYAFATQALAPVANTLLAEEATYQAQQAAIAAIAAQTATTARAESGGIGGVLCTVAKWFTGNVGKGLAVSFMSILGFGVMLGKVSFKPALIVCIGVATIFAAQSIVNAMGNPNTPYSSISCFATYKQNPISKKWGWYN